MSSLGPADGSSPVTSTCAGCGAGGEREAASAIAAPSQQKGWFEREKQFSRAVAIRCRPPCAADDADDAAPSFPRQPPFSYTACPSEPTLLLLLLLSLQVAAWSDAASSDSVAMESATAPLTTTSTSF